MRAMKVCIPGGQGQPQNQNPAGAHSRFATRSLLETKPVSPVGFKKAPEAPQNARQNTPLIRPKYSAVSHRFSKAPESPDRPTRRKHREIPKVCAQIKNTEDTGGPGGT